MNHKVKNVVIIALILLIAVGGYWIRNYIENVNYALNSSIYSSLTVTQKQLVSLRAELNQYNGKQMSLEDFSNIMHKYSFDFFFYNEYTGDYKQINEAYDYLDFYDLNSYILSLYCSEMTVDDMEYHKANVAKICMYFNSLNFEKHTDYTHPYPKLKQTLEKIHTLVKQGENRINKAG